MADEFSQLNFDQDLEEVLSLAEASRWKIECPNPLEIRVSLSSSKAPEEVFQARLVWNQYPAEPPSLKFRDPQTGRLDMPTAWPEVPGFRPTNLDACVNWTLEGFNLHPEWKNDSNLRWDPHGNVILKILRRLQRKLDDEFVKRYRQ